MTVAGRQVQFATEAPENGPEQGTSNARAQDTAVERMRQDVEQGRRQNDGNRTNFNGVTPEDLATIPLDMLDNRRYFAWQQRRLDKRELRQALVDEDLSDRQKDAVKVLLDHYGAIRNMHKDQWPEAGISAADIRDTVKFLKSKYGQEYAKSNYIEGKTTTYRWGAATVSGAAFTGALYLTLPEVALPMTCLAPQAPAFTTGIGAAVGYGITRATGLDRGLATIGYHLIQRPRLWFLDREFK